MDFNSLARKDLQALCKLNKIPANITNVAMAEALKSLETVEGLEDFLNRSPERNVATAAKVPPTGRRTCARTKPVGDESQSVQPMAKSTRRTTTRVISDEIMEASKTPAVRKTNLKEGSTVQRVYSTRRSARLTAVKSIPMEQNEIKIDSLATELSKINLVDVSDDKCLSGIDEGIVLQESVNQSDVKVVDELNDVQVDNTMSLMIENEKVSDVKEELVDELEEKAKQLDESHFVAGSLVIKNQDNNVLGYAMDTEIPHEQEHEAAPESGTELKEDDDQDKMVDEVKEESEQLFNTLDESQSVHEVNVNNMVIANVDENVEKCLMDFDNQHEQLKSGVKESNSQLMTNSQESKAEILNNDPKDVATGMEISSIAPCTEAPSIKGLHYDKENIDHNGIKFEPTKVETKENKKETAATELYEKSLRKLTKMLKKKLQISNDTTVIGKMTEARPALQMLKDNCLP